MTDHGLRYEVNCSILFTELPLLERPAAAKAAGFDAVEFWWPWPDQPVPGDRDVDAFVSPSRTRASSSSASTSSRATSPVRTAACCPSPTGSSSSATTSTSPSASGSAWASAAFNALFGNRVDGVSPQEQDELGRESIAVRGQGGRTHRSHRPRRVGQRPEALPAAHRRRLRSRSWTTSAPTGATNVGFLLDLYHLAANGDDLDAAIAAAVDRTAHVQIADAPGRGEPGSGDLDLQRHLQALADRGYAGWVGLEYKPTTATTPESFGWLPRERRSA